MSRLSGKIGVCVVTAGPGQYFPRIARQATHEAGLFTKGLTNTVTAIKNAQMAESPLLLIGGCAANLSKGRGALQDIDQMSLFKSICKHTVSVQRVRQIPFLLRQAICLAQSGTPGRTIIARKADSPGSIHLSGHLGPVFVEFPIDVLYPFHLVEREVGIKPNAEAFADRLANLYVERAKCSTYPCHSLGIYPPLSVELSLGLSIGKTCHLYLRASLTHRILPVG